LVGNRFPEGSQYQYTIVHRYMTGAWYCRYYVESRIPTFCSDLQITDTKDHPELLPLALSRDPALAKTQFTIGSVSFSCREQGRPKAGYCIALTTRGAPLPSASLIWRLHSLLGYIAPAERAGEAEAVMIRMRDSIQVNPQWGLREIQGVGARAGIVRGTTQEIAGMAERSQRYRDAVDDRIARLRSNATLGVVDVVDSATGRRMTVDSGSDYYWVDHRGMILGTNVDTSPGVDFRRLLELPLR
jgi:hypothetical protein